MTTGLLADAAPRSLLTATSRDRTGTGTASIRRWHACSSPPLQCCCRRRSWTSYQTTHQVRVVRVTVSTHMTGSTYTAVLCECGSLEKVHGSTAAVTDLCLHLSQQAPLGCHSCLSSAAGHDMTQLLDMLYLPLLASIRPHLLGLQAEVCRLGTFCIPASRLGT